MINYVGGSIALVVGLFVFYKFYYMPDKEKAASNEIFWAQTFFERDSFNIALKGGYMVRTSEGDKTMMGFEAIADEYGITWAGTFTLIIMQVFVVYVQVSLKKLLSFYKSMMVMIWW